MAALPAVQALRRSRFGSAFFVGTSSLGGTNAYVPSIGITAENMQTGDFFELSSISWVWDSPLTFKNSWRIRAIRQEFLVGQADWDMANLDDHCK
jgi:hypothetical protein